MNTIGWVVIGVLAALWAVAVIARGNYWKSEAAEWKARAQVRAETIDRLYAERAAYREEWRP